MEESKSPETKISESNQKDIVCKNCAAKLVFEPGTTSLVCPYCSTANEIEIRDEIIEEIDLDSSLQELEADDSQTNVVSTITCNSCGATTSLEPNVISSECPFCGNKLIVKEQSVSRQIKPKSLLTFQIDNRKAHELYTTWLKSLWFAPSELKHRATITEKIAGIYIPSWTYDAKTNTNYTGQRGDRYEVRTRDENNKEVTKTEYKYRNVSGTINHFFDDVPIPATNSLPKNILNDISTWQFDKLIPYDEKFLSGFRAEVYNIGLKEGFDLAKEKINEEIAVLIKKDIGGDVQKIYSTKTIYSDTTFKHILLPIWISSYRYKNKIYRFIINGQNGKISGDRPWSALKITLLILAICAILFGLYLLVS